MIWAGILHDGLTDLAILEGKQKLADYIKMLENNLLPFAERMYAANYVFQQDYAPIHTSKLTRTFFHSLMIQLRSCWKVHVCIPETFLTSRARTKFMAKISRAAEEASQWIWARRDHK